MGLAFMLGATVCPAVGLAGSDYSDKPFSVRLPPAFIRFTEVTAHGGGTVASPWSCAINPAAAGWLDLPGEHGFVVAPYYSLVCFEEGTRVHIAGETARLDAKEWGTFQPTYSQIRSNRKTNRQGQEFDYRVDTFQILWGKRFGDWAVGGNFNFACAEVVHKVGAWRVSESHAESYRFRAGGLYQPAERWLAGLMCEFGFAPSRAKALTFGPFGPEYRRIRGCNYQFLLRPGVSFEYDEYSAVFLDYAYGAFFDEDACLQSHRFSTGVNHRLLDWLFVQAGASIDVRGNIGATFGLSVFPARWCSLHVGYQYDVLPELRPEFSRAHLIQITFSANF
jgi:hypothetical protein